MLGEQIPLQQWSSFFSITAAESATLLGLLFVVITIAPGIGRAVPASDRQCQRSTIGDFSQASNPFRSLDFSLQEPYGDRERVVRIPDR